MMGRIEKLEIEGRTDIYVAREMLLEKINEIISEVNKLIINKDHKPAMREVESE